MIKLFSYSKIFVNEEGSKRTVRSVQLSNEKSITIIEHKKR